MWKAFAEHFKECGRHSRGFFLLGLLGAPVCAVLVSLLGPEVAYLLWVTWAVVFAHGFVKFIHQWRHPVRLGKLPPLSRHDLKAARSKLMKCRPQPERSLP